MITRGALETYVLAALAAALLSSISFGQPATTSNNSERSAVQEFTIAVPEHELADLKGRLERTRFPDQLASTAWRYGTEKNELSELLEYWREEFDWRQQEAALNAFDQALVTVGGLKLHTIHQRSKNPEAIPLLLVHGWPGSVAEFHKLIGPLTAPEAHGGEAIHLGEGAGDDKIWKAAKQRRAVRMIIGVCVF